MPVFFLSSRYHEVGYILALNLVIPVHDTVYLVASIKKYLLIPADQAFLNLNMIGIQ